jgi:hypothetical protein
MWVNDWHVGGFSRPRRHDAPSHQASPSGWDVRTDRGQLRHRRCRLGVTDEARASRRTKRATRRASASRTRSSINWLAIRTPTVGCIEYMGFLRVIGSAAADTTTLGLRRRLGIWRTAYLWPRDRLSQASPIMRVRTPRPGQASKYGTRSGTYGSIGRSYPGESCWYGSDHACVGRA